MLVHTTYLVLQLKLHRAVKWFCAFNASPRFFGGQSSYYDKPKNITGIYYDWIPEKRKAEFYTQEVKEHRMAGDKSILFN